MFLPQQLPSVVSALPCCLHTHLLRLCLFTCRTNGRLPCPALSPKMKSRFMLRRQPKPTGVRPNLRQVRGREQCRQGSLVGWGGRVLC